MELGTTTDSRNGCQTVLTATREIDGKRLNLTAYRNGTGHVELFASSNLSYAGNRWFLSIKKQSDRLRHISRNNLGLIVEQPPKTPVEEFKEKYCKDNGIQEVKEKQRTPEWFLLQKFCITSTVASVALSTDSVYTMDEMNWLNLKLGMRCIPPTPTQVDLVFTTMLVDDLLR
jgi:hypothetical protein